MNKEVQQQLKDECWRQGIEEEAWFILDFCDRRGIKAIRNVTGFVIKWRLNPLRKAIELNREVRQKEIALVGQKRLNERLASELVKVFEESTGRKCPKLRSVPLGLTTAQKEQRRQMIVRQLTS